MKRYLIIFSYSFYLLLLLGLILHTSAHPQIFGKYTVKYFSLLILLVLLFVPFLYFFNFLAKTTKLNFKKRKLKLEPKQKLLLLIVLIVLIISPIEIFLRNKYKNYESNSYTYMVDNFNPFLQSQIAKQENLPVNSLGFRGEEISAVKPQGTYRIVVLGGSTVLNREVPFEQNAVRVLEKELLSKYPNKKIEVINAGKDYYTTEHSIIQFMFKISDLKPDLIIMWHGANDIGESCTLEGVVSHGSYKSDYSHMFGAVSNIVFNYFKPSPLIQVKLLTFDFAAKALRDNLFSDIINKVKSAAATKAAIDFKENKNTITVHDFPSLSAYERNLEYMIQLTKDQNIPLILGDQPNLFKNPNTVEEVKKIMFPTLICKKDGKYYSLASLKFAYDQFNSATKQIAKHYNVMFINLDNDVPKNLSYFLDAVHYTQKGNATVAQKLYDFIISQNLIN